MSAIKIFLCASTLIPILAGPAPRTDRREYVAPPAPPGIVHAPERVSAPQLRSAAATHSIGDPTPEEQLYIEMINRARANPVGEATLFADTTDPDVVGNYDFFGVDLELMQTQFALLPPAPPVAPNAQLTTAARRHSADMLAMSFQEHVGSDDSTPPERVSAAGYNYSSVAENVYANADSVFQGHAGFEVDWGPGPGGMQTPPGHRRTIHEPDFREVGVGVVFGRNDPAPGSTIPGSRPVGPQLVTQEFGTAQGATPFITGVVYFDLNGNNFYDLGEGVGGARVTVSGTATEAVTARSGGYAIPVAGNGAYTVTFTGDGITAFSREVTVSQSANQKLDFLPAYVAPVITGSLTPAINRANNYQISSVAAANAYQWRSFQHAAPAVEGAENGTDLVKIDQTGTYEVLQSQTRKSGSFAFHLAHPEGGIELQSILLHPSYILTAQSALRFESRLGWATDEQTAIVQISTDDGATWNQVYSQAGSGNNPGEIIFQSRTVDLSAFAGSTIRVRFAYVPSGTVFIDTDDETGWFIDDITIENASEISSEEISDAANGAFSFQPAAISDFVLQARARTGHEFLPWGPALNVSSIEGTAAPAELRITAIRVDGGQAELEVDLLAGDAPSAFILQSTPALGTPWTAVAAAVETISSTRFRLSAPIPAGAASFYRIQGN